MSCGESGLGFSGRWLARAGVAPDCLEERLRAARERAARLPFGAGRLRSVLETALEWLGPLAALGRWCRARDLSDEEFDAFTSWLQMHRWTWLRLAGTLVLAPLFEVLTSEAAPGRAEHPLEARLARPRPAPRLDHDVVVIGSGAGGAPVAWCLARAGLRVALLEKGGLVRPERPPVAIEKYYLSQGLVGTVGDGFVLVLSASGLGGTTAVNSGTCLRPLAECLDRWDESWAAGLAGGGLSRWLDEAELRLGVSTPPRSLLSRSAVVFERGLEALGRTGAHVLPRNAPGCCGSGVCCFGCPTGAKRSTDLAFLPEAVDAGLTLLPGTQAVRLEETTGHVLVRATGATGPFELRARHAVLSAGALFTPQLLGRGLAGRTGCRPGTHFLTHPAAKVYAHFPGLAHGAGVPQGLGYRPPELPRVSMEAIHVPASAAAPMLALAGGNLRWWVERKEDTASFGLMIRDRGRGSVRVVAGQPLIRYDVDPRDASELGEGLVLIGRAFFAAGAERVMLPVAGMPSEYRSSRELDRLKGPDFTPSRLVLAGFHPQGTAGIGRVVGPDLRLLGSRRVSVCDASVLPDSPGVNPQLTIVALSLRLGERLAAELG